MVSESVDLIVPAHSTCTCRCSPFEAVSEVIYPSPSSPRVCVTCPRSARSMIRTAKGCGRAGSAPARCRRLPASAPASS